MEQEIIKHIEKLRKEVKNKNHSAGEKIKEILIEIFVIVFAVTLSIWLHNWSEHKEQQNEAKEFLTDIKEDLTIDIKNMSAAKATAANNFKSIQILEKNFSDSTASVDLINRQTHVGDYESFKSSGKIAYIKDREIRKLIITYYEEETPVMANIERLNNEDLLKMSVLPDNTSKEIIHKELNLALNGAGGLIRLYDHNIKIAKDIIDAIDKANK